MCAHAVRVALERLDGVESVTVSLEEGVAVVRLTDENEVSVATVRQVVRDNGFSPKQTELEGVFDTVALPDGQIGVKIGDVAYRLRFPQAGRAGEDQAPGAGVRVRLSGVVPEPQESRSPAIDVEEITLIGADP